MIRLVLALQILLLGNYGWTFEGVDLELISTEYRWIGEGEPPSCGLVRARAIERKRRLREYQRYIETLPGDYDDFFVDSYLLNRYFWEHRLWDDVTIKVEHRWKIPSEAKELFALRDQTFFWLESDGVNWVAQLTMFPDEVNFHFEEQSQEIMTIHETYYADYCNPRFAPRFRWYSDPEFDLATTAGRFKKFVKLIKGEL